MTQDITIGARDAAKAGGCGCGCAAEDADPVLDATAIPHALRHAAIFGALDSVAAGSAMILVAPHDPLPLLAQAQDRYDGNLTVEYLTRGPDTWQLRLTRTAAA